MLSLEFVSACKWINSLETGATFEIRDLLAAARGLTEADAVDLLRLLESVHLVHRR